MHPFLLENKEYRRKKRNVSIEENFPPPVRDIVVFLSFFPNPLLTRLSAKRCLLLFSVSLILVCSSRRYRRRRTHTTRRQQLPPRRRQASRVSEASVASAVPASQDTGTRPNLIRRQRRRCKPVVSFKGCKDTLTASSPGINRRNTWGESATFELLFRMNFFEIYFSFFFFI